MKVLNAVLADDHRLFVEGMAAILQSLNGQFKLRLTNVVVDGSKILPVLSKAKADILFMDLNMPGVNCLELIAEIKDRYPQLHLIVISGYEDPKLVRTAFRNGADGYMLKSSGLKDLHKAVVEVTSGRSYWGKGIQLTPAKGQRPKKRTEDSSFEDKFTIRQNLTKREKEVLNLISQAKSNKEIARDLFISPETVGVHRKNIMRKLKVNTTASLIKFALDFNLV